MRPRPGNKGYVYVTWITGLLSGEDECFWRAWVKSHFYYDKIQEEEGKKSNLANWIRDHDSMTASRVTRLRQEGYMVTVEDDNSFKLEGDTAVLAGKPDIVAIKEGAKFALVVDEKSGKQKEEHKWQVRIYQFALKIKRLAGYDIHGELEYKADSIALPPSSFTQEMQDHILSTIRVVGGPVAPPTTPGPNQCRFCDIAECKDRWKPPAHTRETPVTGMF